MKEERLYLAYVSLRDAKAGTEGRNLEAGTKAETIKKWACWLVSSWLTQLAFFFFLTTMDHLPRWHHPPWTRTSHIDQ